MSRKFGALPPQGTEWQIGKTATSIKFVNHANTYISKSTNQYEIKRLQDIINRIKQDKLVLDDWLTPEDYLVQ